MSTVVINGEERDQDPGMTLGRLRIRYPKCWLQQGRRDFDSDDYVLVSGEKYEMKQPAQPGGKVSDQQYSGIVHFLRYKSPVKFRTYTELVDKIESDEKWKKALRYTEFTVKYQDGEDIVLLPSDLSGLPFENVKVIVSIDCKGFSKKAMNSEEALASIGSIYKTAFIPADPTLFPESTEIDDAILLREADKVLMILGDKAEVIKIALASETTMREFISPVLIGALRCVLDLCKQLYGDTVLSLMCEKRIVGHHALGPVDYAIVFDCLDILLTEAKKRDLPMGIVQNLLQQRASQQMLANTLIDFNATGENRKRLFKEAFEEVAETASYGIASTGTQWVFSKTKYINENVTDVFLSDEIALDLSNLDAGKIKSLLSRIANMILTQIRDISKNKKLEERRRRFIPTNEVEMIALQNTEHQRALEIEQQLSQGEEGEGDFGEND